MIDWIKYIFSRPFTLRAAICRWRGHPCGVIWFNPGRLEPDMRCKNCEDDLG
jgi:hypothetical protein